MKVRVTCAYQRLTYRCQLSNTLEQGSAMRMATLWRVLELIIDGRFVEAGSLLTEYQPTLHPVDGELELLDVITREADRRRQLRNRCLLGHTNPAGAAFCDECGESLIEKGSFSSRFGWLKVLVEAVGRTVGIERGPGTTPFNQEIIVTKNQSGGIVFDHTVEGLEQAISYYTRHFDQVKKEQRGGRP